MKARKLAISIAVALAFAGPGLASAGQLDYSLYTGIEHSNNITLSTNNPISQNVLVPGLDFTFTQQGSALQANVAGNLEYRDYLGGRFDNQTQTQLAGQANWTIAPQRLDFAFDDFAGVQPVDSLSSNAPGNQQQTNILALGPTLHFRLGDAWRGQAELRYINSYASRVDEFNSSREMGALRLLRDISPTDQLSINLDTQHVDFSSRIAGPNYDRNELFARYTRRLNRFDADLLLGWSRLRFDGSASQSKPLARLTLGWRPSTRSTFTLAGAYQFADAAQDLMVPTSPTIGDSLDVLGGSGTGYGIGTGGGLSPISTGNVVISSDVYLERRLEAAYTFRSDRLQVSVSPAYRKLNWINNPTFDQSGISANVSIDYRLSPTMTLSAFGDGERLKYWSLGRRDDTVRFGVQLSGQWTPHWSWRTSASRQRRNSDALNQSYRETQLYLSVVYRR